MSRHPQRSKPKSVLQATVPLTLFDTISMLQREKLTGFSSLSECLETILFWGMHQYYELDKDTFVTMAVRAKAMALLETTAFDAAPVRRRIHATIDCRAVEFLDEIARLHRASFKGRNDVLEQTCALACYAYKKEPAYFLKTLEEVRRMHPKMCR